jgi:two-component system sensor histidine kinase/response regulator
LDIIPVVHDAVIDGISDGMIVLDLLGRVIDLNPAAQDLIGAPAVQAIGQQVGQILPFWGEISERRQEATETQAEIIWNRDGKQYHYDLRISPLTDRRGRLTGQLILLHNITQRMQTEAQIRQLKELNEGIVQNMAEGIVLQDAKGTMTFVNPATAALLGYKLEEIEGLHWTAITPPDQHPVVDAANARRLRGESDHYELELVGKDGRRVSVLVSGSPRFEEGRFVGTMAVFANITERKRAEEELARHRDSLEELVRERTAELVVAKDTAEEAQRQAEAADRAKSAFLASMSHELRTPLNAILGYAQVLQRRPLDPEVVDSLNTIQQSGEHLLILIDDILTISKIETGRMELHPIPIRFPSYLDHIVSIVRARAEAKGLAFSFEELNPLPAWAEADETRLRQVLLSLLDNAVKFTDKGQVMLRVKCKDFVRA